MNSPAPLLLAPPRIRSRSPWPTLATCKTRRRRKFNKADADASHLFPAPSLRSSDVQVVAQAPPPAPIDPASSAALFSLHPRLTFASGHSSGELQSFSAKNAMHAGRGRHPAMLIASSPLPSQGCAVAVTAARGGTLARWRKATVWRKADQPALAPGVAAAVPPTAPSLLPELPEK